MMIIMIKKLLIIILLSCLVIVKSSAIGNKSYQANAVDHTTSNPSDSQNQKNKDALEIGSDNFKKQENFDKINKPNQPGNRCKIFFDQLDEHESFGNCFRFFASNFYNSCFYGQPSTGDTFWKSKKCNVGQLGVMVLFFTLLAVSVLLILTVVAAACFHNL